MKLKFKKQQYQEEASLSVVKCFEGQPNAIRQELIGSREKKVDLTNWNQTSDEEVISFGNNRIMYCWDFCYGCYCRPRHRHHYLHHVKSIVFDCYHCFGRYRYSLNMMMNLHCNFDHDFVPDCYYLVPADHLGLHRLLDCYLLCIHCNTLLSNYIALTLNEIVKVKCW